MFVRSTEPRTHETQNHSTINAFAMFENDPRKITDL